jgi:hypothetical protein
MFILPKAWLPVAIQAFFFVPLFSVRFRDDEIDYMDAEALSDVAICRASTGPGAFWLLRLLVGSCDTRMIPRSATFFSKVAMPRTGSAVRPSNNDGYLPGWPQIRLLLASRHWCRYGPHLEFPRDHALHGVVANPNTIRAF